MTTRDAAPTARRLRVGPPLPARFYNRPTELVARDLLGAVLHCATADGVTVGRVVETEAYLGPDDPACHAMAGLTPRTAHLFGPPGMSYVYFIYGMYWCFNAVTRERGHGAAVLVRAVHPTGGIALMRRRRAHVRRDRDLTNGPGKLCLAICIRDAPAFPASPVSPTARALRRAAQTAGRPFVTAHERQLSRAIDRTSHVVSRAKFQ